MERFYRRHLPHWRVDAPGIVYLVTWHLASGQPGLASAERDVVAAAIRFWQDRRCVLVAWVVMDDHVHVILTLLAGERLEALLHSWKSFTAHQLTRNGARVAPVWQDESFDRVLRDEEELEQKTRYVCSNPLKRWPEARDYAWVWPELTALT